MARNKVESIFLVERLLWQNSYPFSLRKDPMYGRSEGVVPVKAFLDRPSADEARVALDEAAWRGINPFRYGNKVRDWTSFDEGRLRDWLLDHGLEPPSGKKPTVDGWRKWYDQVSDDLDDLQRRAIRQGLDRVVFYQVTELSR
jgi:hypothetical protein